MMNRSRLNIPNLLLVVAVLFLIAFPRLFTVQYYQHLAFLTLLYAATAVSWNIIGGYTGYISLGHSAFFGLGAYVVALTAQHFGWNPFASAPVAGFVAAFVGIIIGWITLRTRGRTFVVVTIALVFITQVIAINWRSFTGGMTGLQLPLPPYSVETIKIPFYYAALILLCFSVWLSWRIKNSKFGLGLIAIREDEDKAESVGVSTTLYKVLAFSISVYLVAVAGGIYAYYQTFIDPVIAFNLFTGVQMIQMTILGGKGTIWGPVLGAFIMQPVGDFVLFQFGSDQIHIAVFGIFLLLLIVFLPQGILPTVSEWIQRRKTRSAEDSDQRRMMEAMANPGMTVSNEEVSKDE